MTPTDASCSLHPDLRAVSTCRRCGRFACYQCSRPDGLCTECGAREGVDKEATPWERRDELGFLQAYVQTVKAVVVEPGRFWRRLDGQGPLGDAFFFGWLNTILAAVPTGLLASVNFGQSVALLKAMPNLPDAANRVIHFFDTNPLLAGFGVAAYTVAMYPIGLVIGGGLFHLLLLMWGAGSGGFGATLRTQCYAGVPHLVGWVPFFGFLAVLWQLVLIGWGCTEVHRAPAARVVGALLSPLLLVACCGCGVAFTIPFLFKH